MSITNPATAHLRLPGAPLTGYDVDVNDAIVRFVAKHQPCTLSQIQEVFLPAPAAGCNRDNVTALGRRLIYLSALGRIERSQASAWRRHSVYRTREVTPPHDPLST